jgi:hypothetical protein
MLALLKQKELNLNNYKTMFVIFTKDKKVIQILIPKFYFIVITNLIYKLE